MNIILIQNRLKKALFGREKNPQNMKEETWQELDEKTLTGISFAWRAKCWMSFLQRIQHPCCGSDFSTTIWRSRWRIGWFWSEKLPLFLLYMHEGAPIKYPIAKFSSIINDLDKMDVKIKDEDQALLLLCSLASSGSYHLWRQVNNQSQWASAQ